jgi:anthranilate synthase component 1
MRALRRVPIPVFLSPHQLFERIRRRQANAFLLESRTGPRRMARYSIIGFKPTEFFRDRRGADPLERVQEIVQQHRRPRTEGFSGGLVGAIAYDAIRHFESPNHPKNPPHFLLGLYLDAIVYDHGAGSVAYVTSGEDRSADVLAAAETPDPDPKPLRVGALTSSKSKEEFVGMVKETQRRIRDGETYQTVLSRRFEADYVGDLDEVYRQIRVRNPSPYMYYFDFEGTTILGSSPEMLVRVEKKRIETFPIAGTRPVSADAALDARHKRDLVADPKENAEHLMLVDLARNDVGRVATYGSVNVPRFRTLESYASVHHLVSQVTGKLRDGLTSVDAFRSIFPAGTVTGAPKIRAMEIIDELEGSPRGFYAGAVGYFGLNGDLDAAITIRTLIADDKRLQVQAGAGIVQDSKPESEFAETQHKANSILGFLGAKK